jgi:histidinol phosphatase-like enzyme
VPGNQAAYLLAVLAKGTYVTVPESLMVGKRLECVQEAMDMNMKRGLLARSLLLYDQPSSLIQ